MAGIRRDLNDPIVKGTTQFDAPAAGSLTFGPSPSLFAGGSGAPISPTGGSSNAPVSSTGDSPTEGETDFDRLFDQLFGDFGTFDGLHGGINPVIIANIIAPYLKGLIKILADSDYINENGEITDPDLLKEISDWASKVAYAVVGDNDLSGIESNYPLLEGLSGWGDYYKNITGNDFISGEEGVVLGGVESTGEFGDVTVVLPPLLPPKTESKRTDGGDAAGGGGGLMTSGGGDTGAGPGPATESKQTTDPGGGDDTGDGRLDVLGEDWEYDPEHDYIYVGDCTFIRVDENGNPIGDPEVVDYEDCSNYIVGGNYSGPDSEWDPTREVNVDIFGEGSIVDTTKDNTEPEEKDKDATEPEEKDKEKTETEEKEKDTGVVDTGVVDTGVFETGTGTTDTGPATESKRTDGGNGGGEVTPTTGTTGGTGTPTESKRTDGGDGNGGDGDGGDGDGGTGPNTEGVITFENMYGYYSNKDGGSGDGGGGDGGGGDGDGTGDGDGDGNGDGEDGSMFKDISLGGTGSSSFSPFQAIPTYTAPTYAAINVPQENYMADIDTALNQINNLIARNSSMFKGLI